MFVVHIVGAKEKLERTRNESKTDSYIEKRFTLIEMMVVVAIIAILAVIGLPYYQEYTQPCQINGGS